MAAPNRTRRRPDAVLAGLVGLDLALKLSAALRPLRLLDGLTIPDDAYLSLTISRGLAHGLGPWYGTGPTSGFQPLYVLLTAPFHWLFPGDPDAVVRASLILLVAADVLALVLLWRLLRLVLRTRFAAGAVALAWVLSPYVLHTTLNGLETTPAFTTLVAFFLALERVRRAADAFARTRRIVAAGALLALAVFARVDALAAAPVAAGCLFAWSRGRGEPWRSGLRDAALAGAVALACYLPWMVWLRAATGDWFPVSGAALHAMGVANVGHEPGWRNYWGPMAARALDVLARRNAFPIALAGLLAVTLALARVPARELGARLRPAAPAALFAATLLAAYVAWLNAGWFYPRYFFPVLLPLLLVCGAGLDLLAGRFAAHPARRALAAAVLALVVAGNVLQPPFARTWLSRNDRTLGYRNAGLWARGRFPAGTVIGALQSGAIGYYADSLVVVNMDGVVNRAAYEALRARRLSDYLRDSGARYLLGMREDPAYLEAGTARPRPGELVLLGRMGDFTTGPDPWFVWRVGAAASPLDPRLP